MIDSEISRLRPVVHYAIKGVLPMLVASIFTTIVLDMDSHVDVLDAENLEELKVLSKYKGLIRRGKEAKVYQYDQDDPDRVLEDDYDAVDYDIDNSAARGQESNSNTTIKDTKKNRNANDDGTKKNYVRMKKRRSRQKIHDTNTKDINQMSNHDTRKILESKNSNTKVTKRRDCIKVKRKDASPKVPHQK